MNMKSRFPLRLTMTLSGVVLAAIAVSFFKSSLFGVDPFQCFAQGSWGRFPIKLTYGIYYSGLSVVFLLVDLVLDKHYIGVATFINMFFTGYIVEFSQSVVRKLYPIPSLAGRVVLLVVGVVLMCFASSLYMTSDLGVSVYDAVPIIISNKSKLPFRFCRIGCDLICVVIGTLCGLMPGVGTLITAFFMGPLIESFNRIVSIPLLYGRQNGKAHG